MQRLTSCWATWTGNRRPTRVWYVSSPAADIAEYNAQTQLEYERIREFIILHKHATERYDSAFWNHCRTMQAPTGLQVMPTQAEFIAAHGSTRQQP